MSDTFPPNPRSRRARLMSSLYEYTNNLAENRGHEWNSGLAASTAAVMLGMGIDRYESKYQDRLDYTEAEADIIDKVASSADEMHGEHSHFMDKFMERMVKSTIPDSAESAELQARMSDPSRTKKPHLSIRVFTSNMKKLSGKMGALFKLQYGVIHLLTWRRPTKTLSFLVLWTAVCMWPHLVLSLPLIFVLFELILPAYLYRHPMDKPEILPVRKRGQTFLEYLNDSDESSLFADLLKEKNKLPEDFSPTQSMSSVSTSSSDVQSRSETTSRKSREEHQANGSEVPSSGGDKTKFVKSQVSLLINMRDLQNLTGDLIKSIDQGERLVNDLMGFKDERLTTFVFYVVIVLTFIVLFLGRFIPWRLIFIQSGWAFLALCHPNAKKFLVTVQKNRNKTKPVTEDDDDNTPKEEKSIFEGFDRQDIIVDDSPEVRIVEVFELQTRNVIKHDWKFYGYSKRLFDYRDSVRIAGKLPHGVSHINKVLPPKEWKYDFGYASNWRVDTNPKEFLNTRRLDQTHLSIKNGEAEGWIYDKLPVDQDTTQDFRRRRLYRKCYRYARPFKSLALE